MAKKEDVARLAEKLMNKMENIRNIGIVAHIDHGKCVAPETRLQMADGSFIAARELFEKAALNGAKAKETPDEIVYSLNDEVKVFSVEKETGKIVARKISHAWKLKGGKTLVIALRNGMKISTTPEHKFLVCDGRDFSHIQAKDINEGQRIVTARETKTEAETDMDAEALKLL